MKTIFDYSQDEWDNLRGLSHQLHILIVDRESPRKLSPIERTKLRIILKSISGYTEEK